MHLSHPEARKEAARVVGRVLLFRVSPNGGTTSETIDRNRISKIATDIQSGHLGPDELYALMCQIAEAAGGALDEEYQRQRMRLLERFESAAVAADSLTLHRFVQAERQRL
ncbi:hypothetical protein [Arthrobacter bambusae]|uniref:Uncharacterized protein n=1 Tax=Arthrobacter bambusae TaxID=1338426 RepID=A0AAW8DD52_9MICC|nr:hypothetical protein [Arthrobacter bambusae]MDP9903220.1 hypothetical protein [Arthrobacter bambusae]MDQ0128786.1 hypothetical protein [Arthrobacter bambusae]MDQ0180127.1 hypothetical protein [Arthrobacter bambusae]